MKNLSKDKALAVYNSMIAVSKKANKYPWSPAIQRHEGTDYLVCTDGVRLYRLHDILSPDDFEPHDGSAPDTYRIFDDCFAKGELLCRLNATDLKRAMRTAKTPNMPVRFADGIRVTKYKPGKQATLVCEFEQFHVVLNAEHLAEALTLFGPSMVYYNTANLFAMITDDEYRNTCVLTPFPYHAYIDLVKAQEDK